MCKDANAVLELFMDGSIRKFKNNEWIIIEPPINKKEIFIFTPEQEKQQDEWAASLIN